MEVYNEAGPLAAIEHLSGSDALAPDFVARVQHDLPNGGDWHGVAGYREMTRAWLEAWEAFSVVLRDVLPAGEGRWLCPVTQTATSVTGAEVEGAFFYTFLFREGLLTRMGIWAEETQAREDLATG